MRLAAFAILVALLICAANHRLRVGVVARREAAQFLPPEHRVVVPGVEWNVRARFGIAEAFEYESAHDEAQRYASQRPVLVDARDER